MTISRIALSSLFLVFQVSAASAQAAAPESSAQSEQMMSKAGPRLSIGASSLTPSTSTIQAEALSTEPAQGLIRNPDAFRGSKRHEGARGALIGTAIGSMLGAAFAYAGCNGNLESCPGSFYLGAVAGAVPGAAVGALIGHQLTSGSYAYDRGGKRSGQ